MNRSFLLLTISTIVLLGCKTGQDDPFSPPYRLSKAEKAQIREGDIILRYGKGYASHLIVELLDEERPISHCSIIAKDEEKGGHQVIHSVSSSISDADGMQVDGLNDFVAQSVDSSVMLLRYKSREDEVPSTEMAERAEAYLRADLPFDTSFDLQDANAIYCSELIERSFEDLYGRSLIDTGKGRSYEALHLDHLWRSEELHTLIDHHR